MVDLLTGFSNSLVHIHTLCVCVCLFVCLFVCVFLCVCVSVCLCLFHSLVLSTSYQFSLICRVDQIHKLHPDSLVVLNASYHMYFIV